jgi:DNA helicase IV
MPNAGGLKTSQVAVLMPGSSEREWPRDFQTVSITRHFDRWRKNEGVLLASWSRFKGLEADAIVILEIPVADGGHEDVSRYVARSRAKHLLTVVQVGSA